ncbi:low molecular weight protein-tyrosine-phosphatase [Nakamurella sp.]|uniref:low molecular weight protein-tyrosine-phosphatase n=1 Tax=Nakamurella sp. TaxID=1869182 RepID=UPI0037836CA3
MTSELQVDPVRAADPADERLHVCVVCTGNICRSPIGEQVLRRAVEDAGLADQVVVTSAGTGNWHVGAGAHHGSVRVLADAGYPTDHTARQLTRDDLAGIDLVLAADRDHRALVKRMLAEPDRDKVRLLRDFDPDADGDEIPDPYYGPHQGFVDVLDMTAAAMPGVIAEIRRRLAERD